MLKSKEILEEICEKKNDCTTLKASQKKAVIEFRSENETLNILSSSGDAIIK